MLWLEFLYFITMLEDCFKILLLNPHCLPQRFFLNCPLRYEYEYLYYHVCPFALQDLCLVRLVHQRHFFHEWNQFRVHFFHEWNNFTLPQKQEKNDEFLLIKMAIGKITVQYSYRGNIRGIFTKGEKSEYCTGNCTKGRVDFCWLCRLRSRVLRNSRWYTTRHSCTKNYFCVGLCTMC